jgi:heme exporter protein C
LQAVKKYWWKLLGFVLVLYSIIIGLTIALPKTEMLLHTMRNVFYHVPLWFVMVILFTISFVYSILYLNKLNIKYDYYATAFAKVGVLFGVLGLVTGMIWARATWNTYWNNDPKLLGAAICLLIYFALFVLRSSVKDLDKRGRVAAVYNVFAYFLMYPAIYIIPSFTASSHPGGSGPDDEPLMVFKMMPKLRNIFYPAVMGWVLIGVWIAKNKYEIYNLQDKYEN